MFLPVCVVTTPNLTTIFHEEKDSLFKTLLLEPGRPVPAVCMHLLGQGAMGRDRGSTERKGPPETSGEKHLLVEMSNAPKM